jgi:hypothetical protein
MELALTRLGATCVRASSDFWETALPVPISMNASLTKTTAIPWPFAPTHPDRSHVRASQDTTVQAWPAMTSTSASTDQMIVTLPLDAPILPVRTLVLVASDVRVMGKRVWVSSAKSYLRRER